MSKTVKFQYKCRQCGKIEENPCCGEQFALIALIEVMKTGKTTMFPMSGIGISQTDIHNCSKDMVGVSDLIGYRIYD